MLLGWGCDEAPDMAESVRHPLPRRKIFVTAQPCRATWLQFRDILYHIAECRSTRQECGMAAA
jgi:hypothetical protein